MHKVHFPVINTDWQKSPVPATDLAEIVFFKFQFLPIESIRLQVLLGESELIQRMPAGTQAAHACTLPETSTANVRLSFTTIGERIRAAILQQWNHCGVQQGERARVS